jgi:hypothetical protein
MPAQQRRRRDQEGRPALARQQLRQGGQQHPIGRHVPRTPNLAAQNRQLVAKHFDLHRIGVRCRTVPEHPQNQANDHQRDRMNHHNTEPAARHLPRPAPSP